MIKLIGIIIGGILLDFFYFPIEFVFLPGINTKMMLGVLGVVAFLVNTIGKKNDIVLTVEDGGLIGLSLLVSFAGYFSTVYNGTKDYAYATYFISAGTWITGAYTVILYFKSIHKEFTWITLCHYLTVICVLQCVVALWIDSSPSFKLLVDSYILQDQELYTELKRLYGIGAAVDVAGMRFALVLVMIFYYLGSSQYLKPNKMYPLYIFAILCITFIGNMIARTTMIGIALGLVYWCITLFFSNSTVPKKDYTYFKIGGWLCVFLFFSLPVIIDLYNTDPIFYKHIRFAFEGFFSLVEKGKWEVSSNEILKDMYVLPDNLKTWIMGDGYFSSPRTDPYFIGEIVGGYYKGTDVGWLRFIFYFGIIGLSLFSLFLIQCTRICSHKMPNEAILFMMLLLINFIVWFKVSTDVFLIFALFLSLGYTQTKKT